MLQIVVNCSTFNEGLALDLSEKEKKENDKVKTLCHQLFMHLVGWAIVKDNSNISSRINDLEPLTTCKRADFCNSN